MAIRVEHQPTPAGWGMAAYLAGRGRARKEQQQQAMGLWQQERQQTRQDQREAGRLYYQSAMEWQRQLQRQEAEKAREQRFLTTQEALQGRFEAGQAATERRFGETQGRMERAARAANLAPIPSWADPDTQAKLKQRAADIRRALTGGQVNFNDPKQAQEIEDRIAEYEHVVGSLKPPTPEGDVNQRGLVLDPTTGRFRKPAQGERPTHISGAPGTMPQAIPLDPAEQKKLEREQKQKEDKEKYWKSVQDRAVKLWEKESVDPETLAKKKDYATFEEALEQSKKEHEAVKKAMGIGAQEQPFAAPAAPAAPAGAAAGAPGQPAPVPAPAPAAPQPPANLFTPPTTKPAAPATAEEPLPLPGLPSGAAPAPAQPTAPQSETTPAPAATAPPVAAPIAVPAQPTIVPPAQQTIPQIQQEAAAARAAEYQKGKAARAAEYQKGKAARAATNKAGRPTVLRQPSELAAETHERNVGYRVGMDALRRKQFSDNEWESMDAATKAGHRRRYDMALRNAGPGETPALPGLTEFDAAAGRAAQTPALPGLSPPNAAAQPAAPAAGTQPITITSDEEFDRLPSGTIFVGPDGMKRRKP